MNYTKFLVLDQYIHGVLNRIYFFSGSAIFLAFMTFYYDFPTEASFAVPLLCLASAFLFGQAIKDCVGVICFQVSLSTDSWKKYYPGKYGNEENKGE
ncbi:hypothetical protein [Enterobacter hormaechei]|uniref:hypothetical protein n=1 Tax=Enterobacter hormaechei TaxID=158836 RepID=UPI00331500AC